MIKLIGGLFAGLLLLLALLAGGVAAVLSGGGADSSAPPSQTALDDIPPHYFALYIEAAYTCPGLGWSVLAAIGRIESDHGRSQLPGVHEGTNMAGARGPMQFLLNTFLTYSKTIPPGGADPPSPYDPHDAIHAAAAYLCDTGARHGRDLQAAIYAYNHAHWYVTKVLLQAAKYRRNIDTGQPGPAALTAINYATGQLGLPYVWGGDGPDHGHAGFDCSGLTRAAYAAAGITLPRTAHTQYQAGPHVPPGQPLQPGDLVFYGTPAHVTHVGLYIGHDQMINAPRRGETIRIEPHRWAGDKFLGATRPA